MKRTQAIELPQEEIAKQKEWMAEFAALEDRPRTYCVVTYGCQMNAHDSETLEGMLAEMGMTPASTREEADFVIFNTCCVRDNAQRRALGNVVWLKELKKTRPELMSAFAAHDAAAGYGRTDFEAVSVRRSGFRHA